MITKMLATVLSKNPSVIDIVKAKPKKIVWEYASMNPAIFEIK